MTTYLLTTQVPGAYNVTTIDGQTLAVFTNGSPSSGGSGGLVPQPANLLGVQIIDPQNVTGVATSTGANTATVPGYDGAGYEGRVWSSFPALTAAWGSFNAVVINAPLTLVWASSDSGDLDAAQITVYALGSTANFAILGNTPAVLRTDTLSGVQPLNTGAGSNSMLLANLNASTARGTRLQRTNGIRSTSWDYALVEAIQWALCQPTEATTLAAIAVSGFTPTRVTNWSDGDTVEETQATQINLQGVTYIQEDYNSSCVLYGFDVLAPDGEDSILHLVGMQGAITCWEVKCNRDTNSVTGGAFGNTFSNCYFNADGTFGGWTEFLAGACDYVNCSFFQANATSGYYTLFDGDFVLGASTVILNTSSRILVGRLCLDSSDGLQMDGGLLETTPSAIYGTTVVYGGQVNGPTTNFLLEGTSRYGWDEETGIANILTFPQAIAGGLVLNGQAGHASYIAVAGGVGTIHTGVATTVASIASVFSTDGSGLSSLFPSAGGASIVPSAYA